MGFIGLRVKVLQGLGFNPNQGYSAQGRGWVSGDFGGRVSWGALGTIKAASW